jgi:GxxExxY protein
MYGIRISGENSASLGTLCSLPRINTDEHGFLDPLIERVIGAAFEVSNVLGAGFLEKVYERALLKELATRGIDARAQVGFPVSYKGYPVGEYIADIVVEGELVVELKCADSFSNEHEAQCLNYLRASGKKIALLMNFQKPRVELKRIIL